MDRLRTDPSPTPAASTEPQVGLDMLLEREQKLREESKAELQKLRGESKAELQQQMDNLRAELSPRPAASTEPQVGFDSLLELEDKIREESKAELQQQMDR